MAAAGCARSTRSNVPTDTASSTSIKRNNRLERTGLFREFVELQPSEPRLARLPEKVFDERGECLTPTQAVNHGRRYYYYVSRNLRESVSENVRRASRLPAGEIEPAGAAAARTILEDRGVIASALEQAGIDLSEIPLMLETARTLEQG